MSQYAVRRVHDGAFLSLYTDTFISFTDSLQGAKLYDIAPAGAIRVLSERLLMECEAIPMVVMTKSEWDLLRRTGG